VFIGGSMMYFKSLLDGIHDLPEKDKNYREELDKLKKSSEKNFLYNHLKTLDPAYAEEVNENDEVRIIRALEILKITGKPFSKIIKSNSRKSLNDEYDVFQFGIINERDILHQRIEIRLNEIIDRGLVEEAESLLKKYDIDSEHPIKRAVNYKQVFSYLNNEYNKDIFYEKALYATRQLAKRQITWLRSWDKFIKIKLNQSDNIDNAFKKVLSSL
jgi:tRNA dimethylallyltransferase